MKKSCTICKEIKDFKEYGKEPRGRFGLMARCRKCTNAAAKKYRATPIGRPGALIRVPCQICRDPNKRADAHHEDYSRPLHITWLCPIHHKARHKQLEVMI